MNSEMNEGNKRKQKKKKKNLVTQQKKKKKALMVFVWEGEPHLMHIMHEHNC